jgi:hypothetical protein
MQYKYLKVYGGTIYGKHDITKQDLIQKKDGRIDNLINTEDGTEFDSDKNEWVKIDGE